MIYCCLGSQLNSVVRNEIYPKFHHHAEGTLWGTSTSPHFGLSAVFLELSWTSAIDPQCSMSLQEHNLPSHALCFLYSKHYSWSGLGLDGIYWENYKKISDEDYVEGIRYALLNHSEWLKTPCIFHYKISIPSLILTCVCVCARTRVCVCDMKLQVKCRYKFWQYIHKYLCEYTCFIWQTENTTAWVFSFRTNGPPEGETTGKS